MRAAPGGELAYVVTGGCIYMLADDVRGPQTNGPAFPVTPCAIEAGAMPDHTRRVIGQLRRARDGLARCSTLFPKLAPALRAMQRIETRLERPLRLAIIGEFNSGKSSLANLMVGIDSLPTAVTSNSRIPTLLYYAPRPEIFAIHTPGERAPISFERSMDAYLAMRLEVGLPAERLKTHQIMDFPGLADPRLDDAAADLTPHNVDAVLWCTVATQAWKESERIAWSRVMPRLRQRGILVVTHFDLLHNRQDAHSLLQRLVSLAGRDFQKVVAISSWTGEQPSWLTASEDADDTPAVACNLTALEQAVDGMLGSVRQARVARAITVTNRIAERALSTINAA